MFTKRKWHEQDLTSVHKTLKLTDAKGHVIKVDVLLVKKAMAQLGHSNTLFEHCICQR